MGYGCGFDMYPRLTQSSSDTGRWASFIDDICGHYIDGDDSDHEIDPNVTMMTNSKGVCTFIEFLVGEHPRLPYDGTKFLRFSSKVSGQQCKAAEPYIREVQKVAKKHFGDRIKGWHELRETEDPHTRSEYYSWTEVYETKNGYYDRPNA